MAASKNSAPTVEYRHNVARGRHELGVRTGKTFVPFATLDNARFDQLTENEETIAGDEAEAEDASE